MKQYGALFTTDNRVAIQEDRKTMTRRIPASFKEINEHPDEWKIYGVASSPHEVWFQHNDGRHVDGHHVFVKIPWAVGDELYIKETHYLYGRWKFDNGWGGIGQTKYTFICDESKGVWFPPTHNPPVLKVCKDKIETGWFLRSPLFMPKWAAREWLRVTAVKVERLQEITSMDAEAEGIKPFQMGHKMMMLVDCISPFANLWDTINGKNHPWERNEWVVAYTFKRISKPAAIPEGAEAV